MKEKNMLKEREDNEGEYYVLCMKNILLCFINLPKINIQQKAFHVWLLLIQCVLPDQLVQPTADVKGVK